MDVHADGISEHCLKSLKRSACCVSLCTKVFLDVLGTDSGMDIGTNTGDWARYGHDYEEVNSGN